MPKAYCEHCRREVDAEAGCPACGRAAAIQAEAAFAWPVGGGAALDLPQRYASFDEFRTLSPIVQRVWTDLAIRPLPDLRLARIRPLPADTPKLADELGQPLACFTTPGDVWLVVHFLSLVMIACGVVIAAVIIDSERQEQGRTSAAALAWAGACVLGGLALGVWISFLRDPNWPTAYWILEEGLLWQRGPTVQACRWEDVQGLELSRQFGYARLRMKLADDFRPALSSAGRPDLMPIMEFLALKVAAAQFLPCLRKIFAGEQICFGVLWLDRTGIIGPIVRLPWSEIERVMSDEGMLYLDCRGVRAWREVPLGDVSFPTLLKAVARVMIEEWKRLPN